MKVTIEYCPSRNGYVMSVPGKGFLLVKVPREKLLLELRISNHEADTIDLGGRVQREITDHQFSQLV